MNRLVPIRDIHTGKFHDVMAGKYSYGFENMKLISGETAKLSIGNFCSFAWNTVVFLGGMHRKDWITTYPFGRIHQEVFTNAPEHIKENSIEAKTSNGDVRIGNDVWIGADVTIMSGVNIGDGAIVSTGSYVFHDVKPYSVVGGNPAKFWFYRFDPKTTQKLKVMKWWNWEDHHINEVLPFICDDRVEELEEYYIKNIRA